MYVICIIDCFPINIFCPIFVPNCTFKRLCCYYKSITELFVLKNVIQVKDLFTSILFKRKRIIRRNMRFVIIYKAINVL